MTSANSVPFVDLVAPHLELEDQLVEAVRSVFRSAGFIGGPVLERFERDFAAFCGVEHCVGVGSGTDALRFALMAAGIGKGDVVVTAPNTFVATVEAVVQSGAIPHFVDIDPATFNMSAPALGAYLETECRASGGVTTHRRSGRRVKAVIPVHLYGQMCEMDPIMALAAEHGLVVVEDACQAHGSEYFSAGAGGWRRAGSVGDAGAFSFYPGKNLGACGEAGAVTTGDAGIADRVRMIRDHGQSRKYHHVLEGYNGRLDALQAAVLSVKLPHLGRWNEARREAAGRYHELLGNLDGVRTPVEPAWSRAVYHLYVVRVYVVRAGRRDQLQEHLAGKDIATGLHYPVPLHLQQAYAHLGYREGDFPACEQAAREVLSLPMFPQIQRAQQAQVAEAVLDFCGTATARTASS